jgi:Tfp pilus assembly protein PilV
MKLPAIQSLKESPHWTLAPMRGSRRLNRARHAFTLIEVTIAAGILFMCLFAILALLSQTLRNARSLQRSNLDCGILAAEASPNLKLEEGQDTGDFGELYAGYRWQSVTNLITNGLFEVEFTIFRPESDGGGESRMTILLFRPDSTLRRVP